jgi:hypothetical protein
MPSRGEASELRLLRLCGVFASDHAYIRRKLLEELEKCFAR